MYRFFLMLGLLFTIVRAESVKVELGEAEPAPVLLHTMNLNLLMETAFQGISYRSPVIEEGVRGLRSHGLRFPGGTLANNYLWQTDSFSDPTNDVTEWAGEQLRVFRKLEKNYGLDDYIRLCKRTEQEPIWVLNIYEETPESAVALIRHLNAEGLHPMALEMGNEPYWDGRSLGNVNDYLRFCRPLAAALKKEFPKIRLGGCLGPIHDGGDFQAIWNKKVAQEDWCDAIVYHEYFGGQGFALEKGEKVSVEAMLHPEAMIEEPLKVIAELAPGKPIWFTEWNLGQEAIKQWDNTGAEVHFLAAICQSLLENRKVIEWACFHQLYDNLFGTYHLDQKSGELVTNASWEFFRLFGAAMAGAGEFRPVNLAGISDKGVYGFATRGEDGGRFFAVNRTAEAVGLELPEGLVAGHHVFTMSAPPENKLPLSKNLISDGGLAGKSLSLPPYSFTLVAGKKALHVAKIEDENLFPRRPDLTLWYEPYAAQQPRFDHDGIYVVKTADFKEKETAVLKMDLRGLGLETGKEYSVAFAVKADADTGMAVKAPDAGKGETTYVPVSAHFLSHHFPFKYDPASADFDIVFLKDGIASGREFSFKDFVIRAE